MKKKEKINTNALTIAESAIALFREIIFAIRKKYICYNKNVQ